ncbi:hypothetical protein [Clostridium algidicarnis]|uniref:hypothetical protein n=1 Tax=Clostridium algidicarnis TaxID=37659 RepID=UPI001C0DFD41|nr:hypothetical protein [Clostridium algidicarnis]MBU3205179.1 hypothetical protein [Clostridium algidicarnis]MBU3213332.1 hypothetical protein [Clostridium algidicarnis]MBU3223773.1 hypothetical protein [Clostridium algidicarnis]
MENNQLAKEKQELAQLGDGSVFIKRTSTGAIKAIRGKVKLEEKKGHIAVIQNKAMITATGYNSMNQFAGVSIITPEKLTLPSGDIVVNPYPIIDPESGTIDKVWVKKTAIGYSPTGSLVMTSSTLLYDIRMYFIQDLNKKVQYNKGAGRMCMEQMLTEEEKKKGMFLPIQGKMGIWVDLTHQEILKCMDTYIQNKLFAERKAQTIAERNALKKHPALCQVYVDTQGADKNKVGFVDVIGFNSDLTREDLLKLSEMTERGEEIKDYKGKRIEYIDANIIDNITEEDLYTARDEEEAPTEQLQDGSTQPAHNINIQEREKVHVNNKEETERLQSLRLDIEGAKDIIGAEQFNNIIQENFRKPLEQLTVGQLEMAKSLINSSLDNQGGF